MIPVMRERDAGRINQILNNPAVRPWIAKGDDAVDIHAAVADERNFALLGQWGACMCFMLQPGIYEVHTQVLPEGRGQWTNDLTASCARWMFTRTDSYEVLTRVPRGHVAAKAAALGQGMRYEFTRHNECVFRGRTVDVDIYALSIQAWVSGCDEMVEIGRKFHDRLHDEAVRIGIENRAHEDDENHNRYVGAAVEMMRYGRVGKALSWYNRWASVCRHEPITVLQMSPPIVRIDHGLILTFRDGEMEVTRAVA